MDTEELRHRIPTPDIVATDWYGIDWRNNQAHCPRGNRHNNGDKDPSLRYDPRKKRIFCASQQCFGEKGADTFALVMEMEGCDFPEAKRKLQEHYRVGNGNGYSAPLANARPGKKLAAGVRAGLTSEGYRVVAEFRFSDELRKVRLEHATKMQADKQRPQKTFLWEHRGADGVWYSGAGDKPRPLYLNSVFEKRDLAGVTIGLEGEAKADLAGDMGFPAFSFKEISEESARTLVDCDVVLWPDADAAGARTCMKSAELILKTGARSVALAHPPPDIPKAGDIVDAVSGLGWTAGISLA